MKMDSFIPKPNINESSSDYIEEVSHLTENVEKVKELNGM